MATREQVVKQAQAWIGRNEKDGTHKLIIDTYNAHKPLARGYTVKLTDEWCATFVSSVSIACGATGIMPTECGCDKMIDLYKKLGAWVENDAYKPAPGDVIFYDWQDNGKGDNTGSTEHTGIIEKVSGNTITIIEGNKGEAVARRTLQVNGRYIRGYGVPKFSSAPANTTTTVVKEKTVMIELKQLSKGATGEQVKTLQRLLSALGYKMQNGKQVYGVDGSFGQATYNAVVAFQKARKLEVDGIVGKNTWNALLKG